MSFESLLFQVADVHRIRYNLSTDTFGQGENISSFVVFDQIPCRLSQPILRTGAGNAERQDDAHRMQERTRICFMEGFRTIDGNNRSRIFGKDRLVIEGSSYEIEKVMVRSGHAETHHLEIAFLEIVREQEEDV